VIPRYLGLLFWPTGQSIDHDVRWVSSPLDPAVWLGAGLIAGLVAVALLLRRRQPLFTFGLLFFLVALAPTSTFLPIRDAMVERRMYLPVLGLAGCVGLGLALLCAWLEQVFPRRPLGSGLAVAGALALVVLSSLALTRNADYSSRLSLWAATVRESPRKSRVYNNLGLAYLEEAGDPHAAQECFEQALARDPDNAKAHNSLCVLLALRNEYEQAGQRCRRATQLDPGYADPWKNLALVEAYTGHCAQARALLAEFERRRIPPRPDPDGHQRIARCREGQVLQLDLSLFR